MPKYPDFLTGVDILTTLPRVRYENCDRLPQRSAIYFVLFLDREVMARGEDFIMYIGETRRLRGRWRSHHKMQEFPAWLTPIDIAWIKAPRDLKTRKQWEAEAIDFYHPPYNHLPGPQLQRSPQQEMTDAEMMRRLQQLETWRQELGLPRAHDRLRRKPLDPPPEPAP
jgi:hypothetical protein